VAAARSAVFACGAGTVRGRLAAPRTTSGSAAPRSCPAHPSG